jgi:hypothetical protein
LVLLAVVLIIALVSVALLGFFPGMASDAQIAQSQAYWQSAQPISILESGGRYGAWTGLVFPHIRIRNSGVYPIRLTSIIGGDGTSISIFCGTNCGAPCFANISDFYYLAPGEEKTFSSSALFGTPCDWAILAITTPSTGRQLGGAHSVCQNSTASPGWLDYKSIGFGYIEYVEGQQITKKQIGKDFIVKCGPPG